MCWRRLYLQSKPLSRTSDQLLDILSECTTSTSDSMSIAKLSLKQTTPSLLALSDTPSKPKTWVIFYPLLHFDQSPTTCPSFITALEVVYFLFLHCTTLVPAPSSHGWSAARGFYKVSLPFISLFLVHYPQSSLLVKVWSFFFWSFLQ